MDEHPSVAFGVLSTNVVCQNIRLWGGVRLPLVLSLSLSYSFSLTPPLLSSPHGSIHCQRRLSSPADPPVSRPTCRLWNLIFLLLNLASRQIPTAPHRPCQSRRLLAPPSRFASTPGSGQSDARPFPLQYTARIYPRHPGGLCSSRRKREETLVTLFK